MLNPELALDLLQEQVQEPSLHEQVQDPELAPGLSEEKVPGSSCRDALAGSGTTEEVWVGGRSLCRGNRTWEVPRSLEGARVNNRFPSSSAESWSTSMMAWVLVPREFYSFLFWIRMNSGRSICLFFFSAQVPAVAAHIITCLWYWNQAQRAWLEVRGAHILLTLLLLKLSALRFPGPLNLWE